MVSIVSQLFDELIYCETCRKEAVTDELNPLTMSHTARAISQANIGIVNMIPIYQVKASPEGTAIRMWEWKGADLPFEIGGGAAAPTMGNQTTRTSTLEERG
jgi:hypothetical protein